MSWLLRRRRACAAVTTQPSTNSPKVNKGGAKEEKARDRQRDRDTERERQRDTDTETDRQIERARRDHTHTHTYTHTEEHATNQRLRCPFARAPEETQIS